MQRALAFVVLALAVAPGCLRVGPGEDLHLVCEEKSASPRMAYGIEFLVAATRVDGAPNDELRLRILEAARHHVITPAGSEHVGFEATLSPITPSAWRFEATGVWDATPPDLYDVTIEVFDGAARAPSIVDAPRTLRDAAWRAVNESASARERAVGAMPASATWDAGLPSCVRLHFPTAEGVFQPTVNVVQARVVGF